MPRAQLPEIAQLDDHPDVEVLRDYDHPRQSLRSWKGVLTAHAWVGADLACFFADAECDARIILFFKLADAYGQMFGAGDMRDAQVGSVYEMDVFVAVHRQPVVDRIQRLKQFT